MTTCAHLLMLDACTPQAPSRQLYQTQRMPYCHQRYALLPRIRHNFIQASIVSVHDDRKLGASTAAVAALLPLPSNLLSKLAEAYLASGYLQPAAASTRYQQHSARGLLLPVATSAMLVTPHLCIDAGGRAQRGAPVPHRHHQRARAGKGAELCAAVRTVLRWQPWHGHSRANSKCGCCTLRTS